MTQNALNVKFFKNIGQNYKKLKKTNGKCSRRKGSTKCKKKTWKKKNLKKAKDLTENSTHWIHVKCWNESYLRITQFRKQNSHKNGRNNSATLQTS